MNQPTQPKPCDHQWVTSTHATGAICADCREPLVSVFCPLPRKAPAGALLYALRKAQPTTTDHHDHT